MFPMVRAIALVPRAAHFDDYLMVRRDAVELHFFLFKALDPHRRSGFPSAACKPTSSRPLLAHV